MSPHELLAHCLRERQDDILDRLLAMARELPDEQEAPRRLAATPGYRDDTADILRQVARASADPQHQSHEEFARRRAQDRLQQNTPLAALTELQALLCQSVYAILQEEYSDPQQVQTLQELFGARLKEIQVAFAQAYQEQRDTQWRASQSRYYWLFENASEAILSFRPREGRIIEANAQVERLLGRPRAEVLQGTFVELFAAGHREQAQWLVNQEEDASSLRLDDVEVRRADGTSVPVSLSCNWIATENGTIAQAILRDMTQTRQLQREMRSYAEQLERRVGERTRELQQSEDRYRALFLQEQRRAQHLSLINEVQQCALDEQEIESFIEQVTHAIQSHFRDCDVTFCLRVQEREEVLQGFSSDLDQLPNDLVLSADNNAAPSAPEVPPEVPPEAMSEVMSETVPDGDLIVMAQAGGHGFAPAPGTIFPAGRGLPGEALRRGAAPDIVHHDEVAQAGEYILRAEACVPLMMENRAIGVLLVQCSRALGLDARDIVALQTSSAIIASHIEWNRLFQQMSELSSFNHTLIKTMLHSLLVVSAEGIIRLVNERGCRTLHRSREELLHHPLTQILGEATAARHNLLDVLRDVTQNGTPYEIPEVQVVIGESLQVFDVRLFRLYYHGEAQAVLLLINITRRWRQTRQLQIMNRISRLFQTSLDIDRVLHAVLVCVTAGMALGFNRAFLLLLDDKGKTLAGAQAIGPSSSEEASRIWQEMNRRNPTLEELLTHANAPDAPLQEQVQQLRISLTNPCFSSLAQAIDKQRAALLRQRDLIVPADACPCDEITAEQHAERTAAAALFTAPESAIAPLIAKERVVGVVLADNLYSGTPIAAEDVQLLETLARQAGLTIDNALTYQALKTAQQGLVTAERLAAIGEMATRISHEIRNPLTTIGGFARNILKKPDEAAAVERRARIIVDEVTRLEELLTDLIDTGTPRPLELHPADLNDIVQRALLLADADIKAAGVTVETEWGEVPPALLDSNRLLQALLNILRNGAQSMPDGGVLYVATRLVQRHEKAPRLLEIDVRDTGVGISERAVKQVFDPFFSTKITGSGLGLAVTRRIVEDHGGHIEVFSHVGDGTTFVLYLPYRPLPAGQTEESQTEASQPAQAPAG